MSIIGFIVPSLFALIVFTLPISGNPPIHSQPTTTAATADTFPSLPSTPPANESWSGTNRSSVLDNFREYSADLKSSNDVVNAIGVPDKGLSKMEQAHSWMETLGVVITALATIVLAWVTTVLARETKRLAVIGHCPQVVVTIEPSKRSMMWQELHVENTGTAPAFDVEIEFDPPLKLEKREFPLSKISVIKPRQIISTTLANYNTLKDKRFNVIARWALAPNGKKHDSLSYVFDAKFVEGMARLGDVPEIELARSVKRLSDEFANVASGFHKLGVNVFTRADRQAEEKEREEWLQQVQTEAEQAAQTSTTAVAEKPAVMPSSEPIGQPSVGPQCSTDGTRQPSA